MNSGGLRFCSLLGQKKTDNGPEEITRNESHRLVHGCLWIPLSVDAGSHSRIQCLLAANGRIVSLPLCLCHEYIGKEKVDGIGHFSG